MRAEDKQMLRFAQHDMPLGYEPVATVNRFVIDRGSLPQMKSPRSEKH